MTYGVFPDEREEGEVQSAPAVEHGGKPAEIGTAFAGFQLYRYESEAAA
ncbi:MAG TPA: hypothetical protein VM533_22190 [Fimbriiglobus sp.]|nr:hypothetical protein [Fimbriiglobus sp.]